MNKAGDGVIITDYQKDAAGGALVIPSKIEGYPVVAMRLKGLNNFCEGFDYVTKDGSKYLTDAEIKAKGVHPYITSVVFPDSITEIIVPGENDYFFYGHPKLTSIVLPKGLKEIPHSFAGVSTLSAIKWPENLEIIGDRAFRDSGFTELVIPEGVKEIRNYAFSGCKKLTSVTIPSSIERIGDDAFLGCPNLTTVKMPAKTIKYGQYYLSGNGTDMWEESEYGAFRRNPKLTGIAVRKAITDTGYKGEF